MPSQITSRKEYVLAKLAARKQKRIIRNISKRLLEESDPITYLALLSAAYAAQMQLLDSYAQIIGWEKRGGRRVA